MRAFVGNNPVSYEIPLVEVIENTTRVDGIVGVVIVTVAVFLLCHTVISSPRRFWNNSSTVPFVISSVTALLFAAPLAINLVKSPIPEPQVTYQVSDDDMHDAIEKDYQITVQNLKKKYLAREWKFTALTNQSRHQCEVVILEDDRYTVYCDEDKKRVSLDTLLKKG